MNLCTCDSEEREHGVGIGVNTVMMSETLSVGGLGEAAGREIGCEKNP